METTANPGFIDFGNLTTFSSVILQDDLTVAANHHQLTLSTGALPTTTFIKVGGEGISPLLSTASSESADLIYTDLSYNITSTATAAVAGVGSTKPEVPSSAILVPVVGIGGGSGGGGGGGESSSSLLSWSNGYGGGGCGGDSALNDLNLSAGGTNCSTNLNNLSFGNGCATTSMSSTLIQDSINLDDLDNVNCSTPSLSNFSFLSDCSESGGGGLGGGAGVSKKVASTSVERQGLENDYVQAWVSNEPTNPFPLPSLSSVSSLGQLHQSQSSSLSSSGYSTQMTIGGSGAGSQSSLMDQNQTGAESDSFSTINTDDLDDLLGPTATAVAVAPSTLNLSSASISVLICGKCNKTFDNPMTLEVHMRLHTGERPYKCKKCEEAFIHHTYLDYHMNNTHGIKTSTSSQESTYLDLDQNSNPRIKKKSKKKSAKNGFIDSSTSSSQELQQQQDNDANGQGSGGPYVCPYCQKGFRHSSWLIMHLRIHTGERPFKCPHCELAFTQRGNLANHLKKHNNLNNGSTANAPVPSPSTFSQTPASQPSPALGPTSTNLTIRRKKKKPSVAQQGQVVNEHIDQSTTASNTKKSPLVNQNKQSGRPVKCRICGEEFSQREALIVHMRSHGNLPPRRQSSGSNSGKNSGQPAANDIPPEVAPYYDKFKLRPCAVKLKRVDKSQPDGIEKKLNSKKKSFQSKVKGKMGSWKPKKRAQRPTAFPATGPGFECSVCNKILLTSTNLTVHMRIHTGEKPYQCSFCKKQFSVQSNLKAHERLHTGEKPYQCSLCDTAFTTRGNYTAHLRSHGVNPYKCSLCPEQFTFSWKLKKHMLVIHNKKMKAENKVILT